MTRWPENIWTPALIKRLRQLWQEGLPTSEIGRRLGITKNAVVGKAHRVGCAPRKSPLKSPPVPKRQTEHRQGCRFIEGEDYLERIQRGEDIYCGAKVARDLGSWCEKHEKIVFIPAAQRNNWFTSAFETLTERQKALYQGYRRIGEAPALALKKALAA